MLAVLRPQNPAPAEERMFERFAVEVRSVAAVLAAGHRFVAEDGARLDFGDPRQAEFGLLGLSTAAKQHLRRGEDLLTLVERIMAMVDAGRPGVPGAQGFAAGLRLLCAIAMAELLGEEAGRYRRDPRVRELADSSMERLAESFARRLGVELPDEVARVFPRFTDAVRSARRFDALAARYAT